MPCSFMVILFWTLHHIPLGDTILNSIFNAMFLQVTIFWTLPVSSGDTILDSVFNAMFLQLKIFWAFHVSSGDTILDAI